MIHPARKYSLLPLAILAFITIGCAAHSASLVLGYGGTTTTNGVGVYPQNASANSERYFRCIVGLSSTETLVSLRISGVSGTTQIIPKPNGNWNDPSDGVVRYVISSGTTTYTAYTIGPFAGYDINGTPHGINDPTDPNDDEVIGHVGGGVGADNQFTISATTVSGTTATGHSETGIYRTQDDNADILEWFAGDAAGIDPISVLDSPTPGIDNGSGSNTYRFRVQYKIPGAAYALNLLPRFGTPDAPPGPRANFADFDDGRANARIAGDRLTGDWWTYFPGYGASTVPYNQSSQFPRVDDFQDLIGFYGGHVEPEVVLIIDGDRSRPHFMQREDPSDSNARDANGIRYFYDLLPTDYMDLMDHIFLSPYAPPGPDPLDGRASAIRGRPVSNNYVAMQGTYSGGVFRSAAGGHTYEFICSDDYSPPTNAPSPRGGAWLQVGHPGSAEHNEFMKPVPGSFGQMQSQRVNTRFSDLGGAAGGFGYPYNSQDGNQYPDVNPVLTAHPYFPRGTVTPYASDASLTINPPGALLPKPFSNETGFGPDPTSTPSGPARVTNDDTILPNFVNIRPDTDPVAPFRGGKWTSASSYTLRINYWQSNNLAPDFIRVMIRKNPAGPDNEGAWRGYTMEKADPSDTNYRNGCVYQYIITPDQLPDRGGPGDYNYQFVTSDGIRQCIFPNRPARYEYRGAINDPADIGVEVDPAGQNDYYAFRVNQAPVLSNQQVTTAGTAGNEFQFQVTYTDADGEMLNPAAQGDRPFETSIYVDRFGNPNGEGRVQSVQNDTALTYTTTSGTGYATNTLAGYAVEMLTGNAAGKRYRIASNTANQIVVVPAPPAGDPAYNPGQLLADEVAATNRFRISDWFHGTMLPADVADLNYADGKVYVFNSASNMVLGPGLHRYYFRFRDDWGSWLFPNDANVKVEGEAVRYPFTGEFEGPEVLANTPPVLTDFRFTPDALTGPDGTTATPFVFSVTYTDEENTEPAVIRLGIDGTADAPALVLPMTRDNPDDKVFTDGAIYKTPPVKLAEGQHIFRAQASDGSGRYPVSLAGQPFLFAGPPSNSADPTSTPLDSKDGPLVTSNTPPTLSFPATDNGSDPANPPGLDPNTGRTATEFTYTVIYKDTDRFAGVAGNPPDYVRVVIDPGQDPEKPNGAEHEMTKVDPTDNDYTDGVTYQFKITGLVEGTPHRYYFTASDGLDRARLPIQGATPSYYSGPIVDEPPSAPQSLLAQDHPNDNGGVIDLTFNASQDDGGGAGDVTEYRVYRTETAGNYTEPAVRTISANGSPTYALQDNTAVTGVEYYYVVRAWDGANESPNSNEEGPVVAIDNIPPQPPTGVAAADPGLGGTVLVTWNLSADDGGGQNDVKEYHIYRATTPTGFTTPIATVPAGETGYADTSAVDGTDYYYMVRSFDGANESVNSNVFGPVRSTDQQPPVIADLFPTDRSLDVPRDTNISFTVTDTGTGVDRDRITTTVRVGTQIIDVGTPTITGTPTRYTVVYNPPADFDYRQVVTVHVEAYDLAGQAATADWRFTTAGPATYQISGSVTNSQGAGLAEVRVWAGEQSGLTDADGNYVINGLINGAYTLRPVKRGFAFTPSELPVTIADSNVGNADFTWQPAFDITGRVNAENGDPMAGVTITDGTRTAVTGANGVWQLLDVPAGTYTIVPSLPRYVFERRPAGASPVVTVGPSMPDVNFVGRLQTFGISGILTDLAGTRLANVQLTATGDSGTVTTTSNASGQYSFTGLLPGRWTVQPARTGYIFRPASQVVDVDANLTEVSFVAVPIYTVTLPAGLSFLAVPILPEDTSPVAVFGAIPAFRYDSTIPNYRSGNANPALEIVQVKPGRGFWVRPSTATTLNVAGTPTSPTQTQAISLISGWNMAGNPYAALLPWSNVGVTAGGPVSNFAYIWDRTRGYVLISNVPGVGAETSIPQNSAMWMKSTGARTVLISPPTGTAASPYPAWTRSAGEFMIPVHASAGDSVDTSARAGVVSYAASNPEAYVMENPPFMEGSVDVYFTGQDGQMLTCDVRGAASATTTYNFTVKTDLQNVPVKVTLPDLSQVPRDKAVILTDVASGKRLWARTMNSYTYNSGSGGERQFRLEIAPNMGGGLSVSLSPAAAGSGGMAITYTLSRPASVQMTIINVAGRTIRTLTRGSDAQAGLNTQSWDLRNDAGARVPPGRYLVRVQAAAEDGQQVTAVAPLMVR